ncbi:MAG: DUF1232 domain-containing protein [Anaerolineae bacterium]|jgi:uncharacterized membrane protein YkvA (DUF1232 family)|nr:DUF1232 domain-containing protein [Anaerolineae bacterium]MDH7474256.1 DUF1232 domain-containing protein [Anaerolineae bacterium]
MTKRLSAPEEQTGLLTEIIKNLRLAWRLFRDSRVPIWQKLIPPATLLYILSPIDIIPDALLGLGQLDDLSVIMLGIWGFIQLCPQNIVQEHLEQITAQMNPWRTVNGEKTSAPELKSAPPSQVIDVDYEVVGDSDKPDLTQ